MINLLSLQEAADYLKISKATLRKWTNDGIIEHIRLSSRGDRRFLLSDLEAFIEKRKNHNNI